MAEVTIAQDVEYHPLLVGLSYRQTIDALAQSETDAVTHLWASLRAFEPPPPAPADIHDGHCATIYVMGDCMPSGPHEGEKMEVDDRLPIRPGDVAAFVYRRGVAPQLKTYLGKWTGGDHSLIAGDRKIDAVYGFLQEKPPALELVPEQDMMAAVRVAGIDRWTVDPSRWPDSSGILALVDRIDLPQSPIASYLAAAEAERQAFFQFLIARCNEDEQEQFYQRHPTMRSTGRDVSACANHAELIGAPQ
jgi:hypothetical protein